MAVVVMIMKVVIAGHRRWEGWILQAIIIIIKRYNTFCVVNVRVVIECRWWLRWLLLNRIVI